MKGGWFVASWALDEVQAESPTNVLMWYFKMEVLRWKENSFLQSVHNALCRSCSGVFVHREGRNAAVSANSAACHYRINCLFAHEQQ